MGIGEACSIGSALAWAGGVIAYKRLGETLDRAWKAAGLTPAGKLATTVKR